MGHRTTIADVARSLGVHQATVSRALNPQTESQVGAETVRRVKKAARELGYVPNIVARGLRTSASMTVGIIIPDLLDPVVPPLVAGIERFLRPRGYTALVANTDDDKDVEETQVGLMMQRRVDGLIIASGRTGHSDALTRAAEAGASAVLMACSPEDVPFPVVTGNDGAGVEVALRHLRELGHRRVVHLAGPVHKGAMLERATAFRRLAAEAGLEAHVVQAGGLRIEDGAIAMAAALQDATPTAVLAASDLLAIGAGRMLRERGLRCPEDVSLIGFGDIPLIGDLTPALTTVRLPLEDLGAEAARLLLLGIETGRQSRQQLTLPVRLVVRDSTAAAV